MSSSSEELSLLENVYLKMKKSKTGIHKINHDRKKHGEYHHLFMQLKRDPKRFYNYLRMEIGTFEYILKKIEHRLTKCWGNWHKQPILPEERLVICLRYLATGSSFKTIAFSFRMGASTVGKIVAETVEALWQELQPTHMPVPTQTAFQSIASDFYKLWNFPNTVGAIDGKHIRIQCPHKAGRMFYNYKHFYSMVLQGIADAHYRFTIIDVGGYGKQSDGGTFQASELYKLLEEKRLNIPEPSCLPGTNVKAPYVFVGDEAYPLLPNLLKPFGRANLGIDEECFNKRLSRCRKTVECAFGILNSKWRLLSKCIETDVPLIESIIKCICVLHNVIIDKEDATHNLTQVNITQTRYRRPVGRPSNTAKSVRDTFKTFLAHNPLIYNNM